MGEETYGELPEIYEELDELDDGIEKAPPTARSVSSSFARVLDEEMNKMVDLLVLESPLGYCKPRVGAVRKHILINRLLLQLLGAGTISFREEDFLAGEKEGGVRRVLHPARRGFDVTDPLKFNTAFRELQSSGHPDWLPRVTDVNATTTAVSQQLDAVGWGPSKAAPHTIHKGGFRGDAATDPRGASGKRKRDGLYYKRFVFDEERSKKLYVARHLFH